MTDVDPALEPQRIRTETFQHDGVHYRADLWVDAASGDGDRWSIHEAGDVEVPWSTSVVDGEFDDALNFLAIRAAQQQQFAAPHLAEQAKAEREHAVLAHLAERLAAGEEAPSEKKGPAQKKAGTPAKRKAAAKRSGRRVVKG